MDQGDKLSRMVERLLKIAKNRKTAEVLLCGSPKMPGQAGLTPGEPC